MDFYRVLRDNKELGPFSLEELRTAGVKSSDLIWIDGKSAAWRFPDEIIGLLTQVEPKSSITETSSLPDASMASIPKQKKRYRLTADHKMVEITEEEAESSQIPRIAEQPPAPKDEIITPPPASNFVKPMEQVAPIVPEEPFSRRVQAEPDPQTLPLEPELISSQKRTAEPIQEFVDIDSSKQEELPKEKKSSSNAGAFIFAGLLFLVAIAFFGYKWYQDQNAPDTNGTDSTTSTLVDTGSAGGSSFDSHAIAMNDDTAGRAERNRELLMQDSIKRKQLADKNAAIVKAKKDSIAKISQLQDINPDPSTDAALPAHNKADTAKNKVKKILTSEDIGKYVRVGVVQPKTATNGVSGVKLVVHNINNRNLSKVHINVMYFDANGNIIKRATIIAPNVQMGKSVTVPVANEAKAANVAYKVTGLLGDHVNLQAK